MSTSPFRNLGRRLPEDETVDVDDTDLRLLQLLAGDGRASLKTLAAQVGLSAPAVSDRIGRLSQRGVITGFSVGINWAALGYSTVAHLSITSSGHDHDAVMAHLQEVPGVEEVSVVTGSTDMLVRIRTSGLDQLRRILAEGIWPIEGLVRTETLLTLLSYEVEGTSGRLLDLLLEARGTQPPA